ncbi:MAG: amidohydrolase family protein [Myxococcota bacterium]
MKVIDCHAHFEPRLLDAAAAVRKMDEVGVDQVVLIPSMNGIFESSPEALLTVMREAMRRPLTRPLAEAVHRATLTRGGDVRVGRQVVPIYPMPDNGAVAAVLRAHPGRFLGWIFLNPKADPAPLETLERWRAVPGFVGVKLHPHWHDYQTELLDPIFARCQELRLPVLIHFGFGKRGDFRTLAERFPRVTMISAHAGFPFFDDLWALKDAYPNLHVDLSSPYLDEALVRDCVAAMGPERCLYGTDAPYGFEDASETYDYGEIKGWVERLPVSTGERERIFGHNFAAILDRAR